MNEITADIHPIIFFDGVCNLCSSSVQFIIKHDPQRYFRFASLQSNLGQSILNKFQLPAADFGSFLLYENGQLFTKSTAALRVLKKMNQLFPLAYGLIIIPAFIRNGVYDIIAKNRYRWFGKKEVCWIPTPELSALFIDL